MRAAAHPRRLRLLCFPCAGGGASAFRAWSEGLPPEIEVRAVQPPGRESRLGEPPIASLPRLVATLLEETRAVRAQPFAFFGHSVGALVAFELARALRRRGEPLPQHLIVSACEAPQLVRPRADEPPLSGLPDPELLTRLCDFDGTPRVVLENTEMMELVLPALRADLGLRDGYLHERESPFDLPITAFAGRDDLEVSVTSVAAWRVHTRARFTLRVFAGGHFFVRTTRARVLHEVACELARPLRAGDPSLVRDAASGGAHAG